MVGKAGLGEHLAEEEDVLALEKQPDIHVSRLMFSLRLGELLRSKSPSLDPLAAMPHDGSGSSDEGREDGGEHPVRQQDRRLER
eukprot:2378094-Heterocapsa_arctica.AAC.1